MRLDLRPLSLQLVTPVASKRPIGQTAKFFLAATAIACLTACGGGASDGGDDSGPGSNPGTTPQPGTSSAACFNESTYREGTVSVVELDAIDPNGRVFKTRVTTTTGPRESFANARPIRFVQSSFIYATGTIGEERQYMDLVDGKEIRYGSRNGNENADPKYGRKTNEPPIVRPVAMNPGETTESTTVVKTVQGVNDEIRHEETVTSKITYVGREAISTPMGTINACRFSGSSQVVYPDGSGFTQLSEQWIAADGPYRGQELKLVLQNSQQPGSAQILATKITFTPK
ncbi:MAG: hypothetical protein I8H77_02540 [Comamonadaceae bacterium]|nr:hypothetical protein [Comamonadaceae bacterium]